MPTQPHIVEALLRSQLMAHMTDEERRDLALRFEVRPFSAGQTLIAEGSEGRKLLEILAGTAEVRVRDGEHGYRVARLGLGVSRERPRSTRDRPRSGRDRNL